jgi:hypothetical protein
MEGRRGGGGGVEKYFFPMFLKHCVEHG